MQVKEIILDKSVSRIGCDEFAGIDLPLRVVILNPHARIMEGTFRDCANVTICAHAGSFAEFYAAKHKIPFERL